MKKFISIIFCMMFLVSCGEGLQSSETEWTTVAVISVNLEQEVSGSDGNVHTTNYYKVYTDKGVYKIALDGIFAHPSLVSKCHPGDTIDIKSMWFEAPILGEYRVITNIKY